MGLGMGVDRRVCLYVWAGGLSGWGTSMCVCMHVCEWGGCFWTSSSSKGPYVQLSASGTLGLAAEPRNKAVCSFPGRASEQVSQSESMTNGWRVKERESEGFKYVHNWALWNGQILQHTYIMYIAVFICCKGSLFFTGSYLYLWPLFSSLLWKDSVFATLQ